MPNEEQFTEEQKKAASATIVSWDGDAWRGCGDAGMATLYLEHSRKVLAQGLIGRFKVRLVKWEAGKTWSEMPVVAEIEGGEQGKESELDSRCPQGGRAALPHQESSKEVLPG